MAPDTPERFRSAASARCPRQDQTRFGGSAERLFRSARLRESPPAPEKLLRAARRRFKRRGSEPQFVVGSAGGCRGQSRGSSLDGYHAVRAGGPIQPSGGGVGGARTWGEDRILRRIVRKRSPLVCPS